MVSFCPLHTNWILQYACLIERTAKGVTPSMKHNICIKEHLDRLWEERFDVLQNVHEHAGKSLLSGSIRDQAALYGIL